VRIYDVIALHLPAFVSAVAPSHPHSPRNSDVAPPEGARVPRFRLVEAGKNASGEGNKTCRKVRSTCRRRRVEGGKTPRIFCGTFVGRGVA
jgi:hypothetical protein